MLTWTHAATTGFATRAPSSAGTRCSFSQDDLRKPTVTLVRYSWQSIRHRMKHWTFTRHFYKSTSGHRRHYRTLNSPKHRLFLPSRGFSVCRGPGSTGSISKPPIMEDLRLDLRLPAAPPWAPMSEAFRTELLAESCNYKRFSSSLGICKSKCPVISIETCPNHPYIFARFIFTKLS